MKSKKFKSILSLFMAVLMCATAFMGLGTTAYAAAEKAQLYLIAFPRDGDNNYGGEWGHGTLTYINGWSSGSGTRFNTIRAMNSYSGNICYCIEPGVAQNTGDSLTKNDEDFWDNYPSSYNHTISPDNIKFLIGRIFQYGYTGTISTSWRSQNEGGDYLAHAIATQLLIWETVIGERDEDFGKVSTGSYDAVADQISVNHPLYSKIMAYYKSIEASVQKHSKLPSFFAKSTGKAQNIELSWNGTKYTASLTDKNGVLSGYSFTANDPAIHFSVSGNVLTITADKAPVNTVAITAQKQNSQRKGVVTWSDNVIGPKGAIQDVVTFAQSVNDPVKGYLNIKVSYGSAKIVKTSEDGKVAGISFAVVGNGINKTVTTNQNGVIQMDNLAPGVYTVTELTEEKYKPQETRRVTVLSGQTATVTYNNTLKRGNLTVTKTSEDSLDEGVKFHLFGTSLSGLAVNEYAVTDSTGKAYFNDVLIGTGYTLEEVDTETRYVVPEKQTAAIEWDTVTQKSFTNILKKWYLTVTKSDNEAGTPQGDASLAGAAYGIYKGEQLIDTYTTDVNGQFTTKYYVCGDDWSLREIGASEGYLLDGTVHHIGSEATNYTAEYNSTVLDVTEQVLKGKIALIKHTDDGSTQLETPEVGAEFSVYLKSVGSYDSAKESERDYLVCDENGYAETKNLPYGVYTVHQESGWAGRELLPDFDVYIAKNGHIYRYLANNAVFKSFIKIVKVDAETGKTIPYAGAGFQLFHPDGCKIAQTYTYPEVTTIDTFYTNAEGYLITPETLEYGTGYSLVEVFAPHSYVLDSTPVYFDVIADNATEENAITVVTVTKQNMSQKGVIKISKTGEVFASVTETDGIYQPVYTVKGLSGAVYEITAAKNIYTLDGTLRYTAGEIVGTVTTNETGIATSKPLYLGKYNISEITAPHGMVLNKNIYTAELVYAGQEIEVTQTEASFYNDRQKVQITTEKTMEQNVLFGIGTNNEITAVSFGLYSKEDITAADGSVIPANGLLEILSFDEHGKTTAKTDLPFGKYYLQEMSTDSHYILSDTKYPIAFSYAGQDTAIVEIKVNDGNAIENKLIYGEIHGLKKDDGGNAVGGAVFGLFKADCTDFIEENALILATSAEDGSFAFTKVPYGNWVVRELFVAPCYVMSEESYGVTVDKDGAVIEVEIENTLIRGTVQLTKVDKDYPDNKLTGAVFEVYRDVNGDKALNDGDKLIGTLTETDTGIYEIAELVYGGYFIKEQTAPTGFYLDENAYYFEITENGKTVVVENKAGVGFINAPQRGSLKIVKTSTDGKLEGFSFRVSGNNGYSEVFTTNENGEIFIENLRIGEYTVSEVADDASAGYILPKDKIASVMDKAVTIVEMHNKIREYPNSPQTGDNSNIPLWLGIMGASVVGIISATVMGRKKRIKEDAE